MSFTTSIITGGSNNHETTSTEANAVATDFFSEGVVGAFTNTSGVAPATGSFAVNAQGTPNMTVAVSPGTAYTTATPTGQSSQLLRTVSSATENVTIAANSTGSTRYDWVYLKIDPDNAADSDASASNVATLVTSRSTSSSSDDGTPPTYGTLLAVVTVANGASSITNGNISDERSNATIGKNQLADASVTDDKTVVGAGNRVKTGTVNVNTSTVNVTGVGFEPATVEFHLQTPTSASIGTAAYGINVGAGTTNAFAWCVAAGSSSSAGDHLTNRSIYRINNAGTAQAAGYVSAVNSDGFTITMTTTQNSNWTYVARA